MATQGARLALARSVMEKYAEQLHRFHSFRQEVSRALAEVRDLIPAPAHSDDQPADGDAQEPPLAPISSKADETEANLPLGSATSEISEHFHLRQPTSTPASGKL